MQGQTREKTENTLPFKLSVCFQTHCARFSVPLVYMWGLHETVQPHTFYKHVSLRKMCLQMQLDLYPSTSRTSGTSGTSGTRGRRGRRGRSRHSGRSQRSQSIFDAKTGAAISKSNDRVQLQRLQNGQLFRLPLQTRDGSEVLPLSQRRRRKVLRSANRQRIGLRHEVGRTDGASTGAVRRCPR